jgi:hypothetical protein
VNRVPLADQLVWPRLVRPRRPIMRRGLPSPGRCLRHRLGPPPGPAVQTCRPGQGRILILVGMLRVPVEYHLGSFSTVTGQ